MFSVYQLLFQAETYGQDLSYWAYHLPLNEIHNTNKQTPAGKKKEEDYEMLIP